MSSGTASAATPPPPAPESSPLSAHFGGPALLFGAYLFFYSWLHLFYYFKTFGIPLVSLDISLYFYLAFAWTVAKQFGGWILIILGVGAFVYVALNSAWSWDSRLSTYFVHKVLFAIFLIICLWCTSELAEHFGTLQAQQVRDGGVLQSIRLHFDEKQAKSFPVELTQEAGFEDGVERQTVLLIETATTYYVLVQRVRLKTNKEAQRYDAFGKVYQVPKKQVTYVEIDIPNRQRVDRAFVLKGFEKYDFWNGPKTGAK